MNKITLITAIALSLVACSKKPSGAAVVPDDSMAAALTDSLAASSPEELERIYPYPSAPEEHYEEPSREQLDSIALANTLPFTPDTTLSRSQRLADAARSLENNFVRYENQYVRISYPGGDVPPSMGVCTDVLIRAMRRARLGDLQVMIRDFRHARGETVDTNIDHRRVRNLMYFFDAQPECCNDMAHPFAAGRILIWDLGGGQLHVGVMVSDSDVIHNYCCGQNIEPAADQPWILLRSYRLTD